MFSPLITIVDVFFLFTRINKVAKHKDLQSQWEEILPDKENVDSVVCVPRKVIRSFEGKGALTEVPDWPIALGNA